MLDGGLFDKLEQLARKVRKSDEPFGGLQLVLCGDFFQLPPIGLSQNPSLKFLFEADAWPRVVRRTVLPLCWPTPLPHPNQHGPKLALALSGPIPIRPYRALLTRFPSPALPARVRACVRACVPSRAAGRL